MNTVTIPDCPALKQGFEPEPVMRPGKTGDWIIRIDGEAMKMTWDDTPDQFRVILIHPDDWFIWHKGDPRPLTLPVGCQTKYSPSDKAEPTWRICHLHPTGWGEAERRWRKSLNPDLRFEEQDAPEQPPAAPEYRCEHCWEVLTDDNICCTESGGIGCAIVEGYCKNCCQEHGHCSRNWCNDRECDEHNYLCECKECGKRFYDTKQRPFCKRCAAPEQPPADDRYKEVEIEWRNGLCTWHGPDGWTLVGFKYDGYDHVFDHVATYNNGAPARATHAVYYRF